MGREALVDDVLDERSGGEHRCAATALRDGASEVELASAVSFAAVIRIARFPTSNEFGDWDTALHTFTFANAVEQGLRRSPSSIFCAAFSTPQRAFASTVSSTSHLTRLPAAWAGVDRDVSGGVSRLLDRRQQVAGGRTTCRLVSRRRRRPGHAHRCLGAALVREDRNFHTIQCVERPYASTAARSGETAGLPLIAAARYLAAHAATARSQRQTFEIARRLHRGERLYEDDAA